MPTSHALLLAMVAAVMLPLASLAQSTGHGNPGHSHGADGTGHDMARMPGLRGENASAEESAELAVLFRNFRTLSREVAELPDGIRTVTRASDPAVAEALISHVVGMVARVGAGDDPRIFIQSPTLDIFFARHQAITSEVEVTEDAVIVTQTSTDPEVVAALKLHAKEVTRMVDQGMHAVHMMMMERAAAAQ